MLLQEAADSLSHPLVTLVDELLPEVAVDLLGRDLLAEGQGDVVEVGHLERIETKRVPSVQEGSHCFD